MQKKGINKIAVSRIEELLKVKMQKRIDKHFNDLTYGWLDYPMPQKLQGILPKEKTDE